jgi:hypothetical protein
VSGFRLRSRPRAQNRALLTPKTEGNAVTFLLAEPARREYRHPEMRPQDPPGKINLWLSGPLRAPPWPRKGAPKERGGRWSKVFAAGARKRRIPSEKPTAVLAPGWDKAMALLRKHRNALDQAELSPRGHRLPQRPARYPLVGRYFILRWEEFPIIPYLGLPTGVATASGNFFAMATIA